MSLLKKAVVSVGMLMAASTYADTTPTYSAPYSIDVAYYVSPTAISTYGKEAVFNALQNQLELAQSAYDKSGSDVTFNLKEIYVASDDTFNTTAKNSGLGTVASCVKTVIEQAGLVEPGVSGSFFDNTTCDSVFPDKAQGVNSEIGQLVQRTGADWVIAVTSDYGSDNNIGNANGRPVSLAVAINYILDNPTHLLVAHEMGHLFSLYDRYALDSSYCSGSNANMLMCGESGSFSLDSSLELFSGSETTIDATNLDTTAVTVSNAYDTNYDTEKMQIARALAGFNNFYYTQNENAIAGHIQDGITNQAYVKLTAATTTIAAATGATVDYTISLVDTNGDPAVTASDASVEIYTDGDTATAGTDYDANNFIQRVTFLAGETSKTVSLPILRAGFNGTRMLTVGIRNGTGVSVLDSADAVTLAITDTQTSSSSPSSSGGGGGAVDAFLALLLSASRLLTGAKTKKKAKVDLK